MSWVVIVLLMTASARRLVLLCGALFPRPSAPTSEVLPSILAVIPAYDEEAQIEPLLRSLERLDYPPEQLSFVLVDDGSTDGTAEAFRRWCRNQSRARTIVFDTNLGKASSINAALKAEPNTQLLAIYDADQRPRPDSLRKLAQSFRDSRVGAVSGYRRPTNAEHGIVSRYAALESWVHQLIVQSGKDRWGWNPTTMGGNCVYRRTAVADVGGFPERTCGEDVDVSLALIAKGWRTVFLRGAIADSGISQSLREFIFQRVRWTYGMYGAGRHARSIEALMVSSGYADRLAFAVGCLFAVTGRISAGWLAIYLSAPFLEVVAALAKAGRLHMAPVYFLSAVPMFFLDIALTAYGTSRTLARRRPLWSSRAEA